MSPFARRLHQAAISTGLPGGGEPGGPDRSMPPIFTSSSKTGTWSRNPWEVYNEVWSGTGGPQTIYVWNYDNWYVDSNQPRGSTVDEVHSYPCTVYNIGPIAFSALNSMAGTWTSSSTFVNGDSWNVAYDMWVDNYNIEIMIWNNYSDNMNWMYWYNNDTLRARPTIDGIPYYCYTDRVGTGGGGIWMVRDPAYRTSTGGIDIKAHFDWLIANNWLSGSSKLHRVNYGSEICYTGGTFKKFSLDAYTLTWS